MTNIINSDIFESHCEMIVLPISTAATLSFSFQSGLEKNEIEIAFRKNSYQLGDIEIHKIQNHKYIKFIVLACSVKGQTSNYLSISVLVNKIANATKRLKSIKSIGMPLLGTGAGRLSYHKSLTTLFESFYKISHQNVDLIFCIPDNDTFIDLHRHFFTSRGVSILRIKQLIFINQKTKSKRLDLGNCGIEKLEVLPELFDCTHLETLILSNEWGEFVNGHWVRKKVKIKE